MSEQIHREKAGTGANLQPFSRTNYLSTYFSLFFLDHLHFPPKICVPLLIFVMVIVNMGIRLNARASLNDAIAVVYCNHPKIFIIIISFKMVCFVGIPCEEYRTKLPPIPFFQHVLWLSNARATSADKFNKFVPA